MVVVDLVGLEATVVEDSVVQEVILVVDLVVQEDTAVVDLVVQEDTVVVDSVEALDQEVHQVHSGTQGPVGVGSPAEQDFLVDLDQGLVEAVVDIEEEDGEGGREILLKTLNVLKIQ